jgi:hypothetical protein
VTNHFFDQKIPHALISLCIFTGLIAGTHAEQIVSKSTSFEYDSVTGLLKQEVVEPNDALQKIQNYYQYDDFGNLKEVKITALDQNPLSFKSPTLVLRDRVHVLA